MKITKLYPLGEPVPEGSIYLQTIYKKERYADEETHLMGEEESIPYMMFLVNDKKNV